MRITIFYLGRLGAGPVYSLEMAKALSVNYRIQVILSDTIENKAQWETTFINNTNVQITFFPTYHNTSSFIINSFKIKNFSAIVKEIKAFNPTAIYSPFLHLWSPIVYFLLRKFTIISTIHDVKTHYGESKILTPLYYLSIKLSNKIIILNHKDINLIMEKGFKKSDICVIPHASFSYYNSSTTFDKQEINHTILFIGRIEKYKGIQLLLDSFEIVLKKIPNLKLVIAGNGDLKPYLKQIEQHFNSITTVNSWLSDQEIGDLALKTDFIVLPYIDASQSGIIPLAFGCGKTVVATNVGSLSEQVPSGTGLIVEPNENDVATAIINLYSSPENIIQYGINALEYSLKELSWEKSAATLVDFISKGEMR